MRLRRPRRIDAHRVVPGLWVGSAPDGHDVEGVIDLGINAVVDLRAERGPVEYWPADIEVRNVALVDHGTPTVAQLTDAADAVVSLMRAGREVLVHCHAGLERGPTVACAALVASGWQLRDAYDVVMSARPGARPTDGQMTALREFAARHGA